MRSVTLPAWRFAVATILVLLVKLPCAYAQTDAVTAVSAASYETVVAPDSIAALFGVRLSAQTLAAATQPLPTALGGVSVRVNGETAQLFFVSAGQINFLVPAGIPAGTARVTVTTSEAATLNGTLQISTVAPGLFTANASAQGVIAAVALRDASGRQSYESVSRFDDNERQHLTRSLRWYASEQFFLILYLTGIRHAAPSQVRVSLGGIELTPAYVGAAPGLAGLDQLNVAVPNSFAGRGRLNLQVRAEKSFATNVGEVELGGRGDLPQPQPTPPLSFPTLLLPALAGDAAAGQDLNLGGCCVAGTPGADTAILVRADGVAARAEVLSLTNGLRIRLPYGAGSGLLHISNSASERTVPVALRTSLSGVIETARQGANGALERLPLAGARVRIGTQLAITNAEGFFMLNDLAPAERAEVELLPPVGWTNAVGKRFALKLRAGYDNQLPRHEELIESTAAAANVGEATLAVGYWPAGRTPAPLPKGFFSQRIAVVTPLDQPVSPAAKLRLPNADGWAANETLALYQLDQRSGSATLGQWLKSGNAVVTADGGQIESVAALTEGGFYFAGRPRSTAFVSGRVLDADGTPVLRAVVQARGQVAHTDGNGGFVLTDLPVAPAAGETLPLEISVLHPDGHVARYDAATVTVRGGEKIVLPQDIVLPPETRNQPPVMLVPLALNVTAGETRDFDLFIRDVETETNPRTSLAGTATTFAALNAATAGRYQLRLAPSATQAAGAYNLDVTATDVANASNQQRLTINVTAANNSQPQAFDQSLVTPEDTPLNFTLSGRDASGQTLRYAITAPPLRGALSGTPPNLTYTPARDFNGLDRITFTANNSTPRTVSFSVTPVNDAPQLSVPTGALANVGTSLRLVAQASDADGANAVQLSATNLPAGASFTVNGAQGLLQWVPSLAQLGPHSISVTARDQAAQVNQSLNVSVVGQWAKTSGPAGGNIEGIIRHGTALYGLSAGEIYRSNDNGLTWVEFQGNLTGRRISFISGQGNAMVAATVNSIFVPGKIFRSFDGGQNWIDLGEDTFGSVHTQVLFQGRHYIGTSVNGLVSFCAVGESCAGAPDLPRRVVPQSFFIESLLTNGQALFVFTAAGDKLRWKPGGQWEDILLPVLEGKNGSLPIAVGRSLFSYVPNANNTTAVLFRSDDDGQSWARLATPLPANLDLAQGDTLVSAENALCLRSRQKVWRTLNQGASWEEITGNLAGQTLRDLRWLGTTLRMFTNVGDYDLSAGNRWVLLPRAPLTNSDVQLIVAGTSLLSYSYYDGRTYRSNDGGQSWTLVQVNAPIRWASLQVNGTTWFADSPNGLQRSTDNGQTWSYANVGAGGTFTSLFIASPNLFFASTSSGFFRSTDDARTWTAASAGLPTAATVIQTLAVGNVVYALVGNQVFRSNDGGQNWALAGRIDTSLFVLLQSNGTSLFAISSGPPPHNLWRSNDQGATWQGIGPDSQYHQSNLLIDGTTLYLGSSGRIHRSRDNGTTWTAFSRGITVGPVALFTLYQWRGNVLATAFANSIEPNNNGIFLSNDQGETWRDLGPEFRSRPLNNLVWLNDELFLPTEGSGVYRLAGTTLNWSPSNQGLAQSYTNTLLTQRDTLFAGTLNGVFRSTDRGATWTATSNGLPASADVRALAGNGATLWAAVWGSGVYRSADSGATWTALSQGLTDRNVSTLFINGTTLYAGTASGVFRSLNGGSWTAFNAGLAAATRVTALATHNGALYAATESGQVARLNGDTWQPRTLNDAPQSVTSMLSFGGALYATLNGSGVWVSRDDGATWTAINQGLPEPLNAFGLTARDGKLYLGGVYGVFVSANGGATWQQVNAGLPQIFITALALSGNQLFVSTARGGVFSSAVE